MLRVDTALLLPLASDSGICSLRSIWYSLISSKSCLERRVRWADGACTQIGKQNTSDRAIALESSAEATPLRWYEGSTTRVLMMQCSSGSCFSRADLKSLMTLCDRFFSCVVPIPSFLHLATMSGKRAYCARRTFSSLNGLFSLSLKASAIQPMIRFEVSVLATRNSYSRFLQLSEMVCCIRSVKIGWIYCS